MNRKAPFPFLFFFITGIAHLIIPFDAYSIQVQQDTLRVTLDEVRIEASRLTETRQQAPFSLRLVSFSREQRQSAAGLSLTEPLQGLPGIWINDRHNYALGERISIRGMGWRTAFGVRGIYVMLDGVPLTMPDGQTILSLMDPSFIRDVELIRGPSSVFWGNAGGGALLLSTKSSITEPFVRARFAIGNLGYYKTEFETGFLSGANRYQLFGSHTWMDGFRDHSRFEAYRFGGNADIELDQTSRMRITASVLESPVSDNPGSLTAEDATANPEMAHPANVNQKARKMTRHGQVGIQYDSFYENGEYRINAYGIGRRLQNPLSFAWIQVDRLAGGLRMTYNHRLDSIDFGIGTDAGIQSDSRRNWANVQGDRGDLQLDQQEEVYNLAGFSRIRIPFGQFALSGGIRVDWLEFHNRDRFFSDGEDTSGNRPFWSVSPMAGITFEQNEWLFFLNFSTGFESPTTTELVNRPDMTGGFNPDLQPERSNSLETGFRTILDDINLTLDTAIFYTWVQDLLSPFRTEEGGDRDFYRNVGSTNQWGAEIYANWEPVDWSEFTFSYTYSNFKFDDSQVLLSLTGYEGNRLPGIPEHRAFGASVFRLKPAILKLEAHYTGWFYVENNNTEKNEAHIIINANVSVPNVRVSNTVSISPFLQMNNLLNTRYNSSVIINAFGGRYYEPAPGINFIGGISVIFN